MKKRPKFRRNFLVKNHEAEVFRFFYKFSLNNMWCYSSGFQFPSFTLNLYGWFPIIGRCKIWQPRNIRWRWIKTFQRYWVEHGKNLAEPWKHASFFPPFLKAFFPFFLFFFWNCITQLGCPFNLHSCRRAGEVRLWSYGRAPRDCRISDHVSVSGEGIWINDKIWQPRGGGSSIERELRAFHIDGLRLHGLHYRIWNVSPSRGFLRSHFPHGQREKSDSNKRLGRILFRKADAHRISRDIPHM